MENTVIFFKSLTFSSLNYREKVEIKSKGRPSPDLDLRENAYSRGKNNVRKFNPTIYHKYDWICGCE